MRLARAARLVRPLQRKAKHEQLDSFYTQVVSFRSEGPGSGAGAPVSEPQRAYGPLRALIIGVDDLATARLRNEQVGAPTVRGAQELDCRVAARECGLDRLTHREPPRERGLGIARFQLLEVRRYLQEQMRLVARGCDLPGTLVLGAERVRDALALGIFERRRPIVALQTFVRAVVTDRPLDIDSVRRKSRVQPVGHRTVEVAVVLAREGAELGEVECGVARLEGIHRPSDHFDALIEAVIALGFLERFRE